MLSDGESPWTVTCVQVTDERELCCDCRHTLEVPWCCTSSSSKRSSAFCVTLFCPTLFQPTIKKVSRLSKRSAHPLLIDAAGGRTDRSTASLYNQSHFVTGSVRPKLKGLAHTHRTSTSNVATPIHAREGKLATLIINSCKLALRYSKPCTHF
jgi:hypothetical protein